MPNRHRFTRDASVLVESTVAQARLKKMARDADHADLSSQTLIQDIANVCATGLSEVLEQIDRFLGEADDAQRKKSWLYVSKRHSSRSASQFSG